MAGLCGGAIEGVVTYHADAKRPWRYSRYYIKQAKTGELAEAVGITQPGVTRSVAQLVQAGLLETEQASDDQRRRIVSLTRQGQKLVASAKREVWPRIRAAVAELCENLDGPLLDQLAAIEDGLAEASLDRRAGKAKP